jgi:hypothetical protein
MTDPVQEMPHLPSPTAARPASPTATAVDAILAPVSPATLADVRALLVQHGVPVPAGSAAADLDVLLADLAARGDDVAFRDALDPLLRRLRDPRIHPALVDGPMIQERASVGALVKELSRGTARVAPALRRRAASLPMQAMTALMVLAMAVACGDKDDDDDDDTGGDTDWETCDEAEAAGFDGQVADIFCDVVEIIAASSLNDDYKGGLTDCVEGMSSDRRAAVLDELEAAETDEALQDALLDLVYSSECDSYFDFH